MCGGGQPGVACNYVVHYLLLGPLAVLSIAACLAGDQEPSLVRGRWIILPTSKGGLKHHRSYLPEQGFVGKAYCPRASSRHRAWKDLLLQRIHEQVPVQGSPWRDGVGWIFTETQRTRLSRIRG